MTTEGLLLLLQFFSILQLSWFDEWTGWALLVLLAFYDCCAVLSPYGPLNALVRWEGGMENICNDWSG